MRFRHFLVALTAFGLIAAPALADEAEPPAPSTNWAPESGKLLATAGLSQIEGAGGGGLATWAIITGYGTRDAIGANAHYTYLHLPSFALQSGGVAVGLYDRVELSATGQFFNTGAVGGDRNNGYSAQFEGSAALLLTHSIAVGGEYRTKPDDLRFAREDNAWDLFATWFINKNISTTLAYASIGRVAGQPTQGGLYQAGRAFSLSQVTLHRGDSIRFVNADNFLHQVSVEGPDMHVVSDEQEPGTTNTLQFNSAGLFQVMCEIHPKMHLAVTVQ